MKPLRNPSLRQLGVKYTERRSVYRTDEYEDEGGSIWSITITGTTDMLQAMLQSGELRVVATPLDVDAWKERLAAAENQVAATAEHDSSPARPISTDSAPLHRSDLPTLELRAALIKPNFESAFYAVTYAASVPDAGSSTHYHILYVGADSVAYASWIAKGEAITVKLGGKSGTSLASSLRQNYVHADSEMNLVVTKTQGTSYDLSGDVIVPPSQG